MTGKPGTALITGGNGNLGRLVGERLKEQGVRVIKFDIPGTGSSQRVMDQSDDNEVVVQGDVRDVGLLRETMERYRPDTIFHLASLLSGSSEADIQMAWEVNASASFQLMQLAMEFKVGRFFFASTLASYGEVEESPMVQDFPQWPSNLYGVTKIAVERLGVYFKLKHGVDFRCLRFPLVLSPFAPKAAVTAYPSHALRAAFNQSSFVFPVSANISVSTIFLDDVVDSIVQFTAADRDALTQHAYSLHAYCLSTTMVIDAARKRFPGFEYRHEIIGSVEELIGGWPSAIDDEVAKKDWEWNPAYDFEKSVMQLFQMFSAEAR